MSGSLQRLPPLNSLVSFDAAARHLNFRKAAEELHLTQGAVAQQVRKLEAALQTSLFLRKARGLELTPSGRRYHAAIRRALDTIGDATAALSPDPDRVVISVPPSFASKWLVPRLPVFVRDHPRIELQAIASETLTTFGPGEADMAIRQAAPPFDAAYAVTPLAELDLVALGAPATAKRLGKISALDELAGELLIQDGHHHWSRLLAGGPKLRLLQLNQTGLAMDTAAAGEGIALAPRLLAADDINAGKLAVLCKAPRSDRSGYYLIYPKSPELRPAGRHVVRWLTERIAAGDRPTRSR